MQLQISTLGILFSWLIIANAGLTVTKLHQGRSERSANVTTPERNDYFYVTYYYDQQVDHFGFANNLTFKQRYLVAAQFWDHNGGPIFFYTGNEGDIELFSNNTGFMWDIAPEFKALLIFAEHRYYGQSMPYGSDSFNNSTTLNYLTSEQALADFAELIRYIKSTFPGAGSSQVVAFGGSYGGMLAAWMRIKYPNIIIGSLASSAPIWMFPGLIPCNNYYDTTSAAWLNTSVICVENIKRSFDALSDISHTDGGFQFITQTFGLCSSLTTEQDLDQFKFFLADTYVGFAMVNYPSAASFLAKLPAWPIKVACSYLSEPMNGKSLLEALSNVTNLYYNYSGEANCLNWTTVESTGSLDDYAWKYQTCTEMVMPQCSNNSAMFYDIPWDFQEVSDDCFRKFQVRPRENWITLEYWAKQLNDTSNIIFSNGLIDPWSSGGVLESISDTVVAIKIPQAAHHLDLRAKSPDDINSVIAARAQELDIIKKWLKISVIQDKNESVSNNRHECISNNSPSEKCIMCAFYLYFIIIFLI